MSDDCFEFEKEMSKEERAKSLLQDWVDRLDEEWDWYSVETLEDLCDIFGVKKTNE